MASTIPNKGRVDAADAQSVTFGPFSLRIPERLLLQGGTPVQIGSRSLDLLILLIRNPGQVVSKRDLINQVWHGLTVEEGALRVHITGLRKALRDGQDGARYIANVPGRGYSFVGSLDVAIAAEPKRATLPMPSSARLPPLHGRVIGRDDVITTLANRVEDRRFVSLVGPGGIGKTTVAIEAAHRLIATLGAEVFFVNLSVIADPDLVHSTIASMLGVASGAGNPLESVVDFLGGKSSLLILDSCEHLVDPIASLLDAVYRDAPLARILTTSREPLRTEGEHIVRLRALEVPPENVGLTAERALRYSAVQFFVDRVCASVDDFAVTDENAQAIGDICRKLDGVALAIELSAGRVEAFGITGTADLLGRQIGLLWRGRRTAPPRHQTLEATLDWSHNLLGEIERIVFARLAVFAGNFTLEAAEAVVSDASIDRTIAVETLASLVSKSLVSAAPGRSGLRYRLLDTTRTYARSKLAGETDGAEAAKRHADYFAHHLRAGAGEEAPAARFLDELSDVRAALEWSFADGRRTATGIDLAAAAAPFLLEHSLCDECHRWTQLALAGLTDGQTGTLLELELQTALAWSGMFSGNGEAVQGAFERGLALAELDPDPHRQLSILNGLNFIVSRKCDFVGALELAQRAADIARGTGDPSTIALSDWALGVCHHLCGHQSVVDDYCRSAIRPPVRSPYVRALSEYGYDYRGRALIARARALFLRGCSSQAAGAAHGAIEMVEELSHPVSLFVVLTYAATVFIWCNEWLAAEATINRLLSHAQAGTLVYRNIGAALKAMLDCRRRARPEDADALWRGLDRLVADRHLILVPLCRTTLADALLAHGRVEEARAIIDIAVADFEPAFETVDGPEILRVKGMVEIASGRQGEGSSYLLRALDLAREQSALAWELRAATDLAGVTPVEDGKVRGDLASVYARFTEGHDIDDLRRARLVLNGRA